MRRARVALGAACVLNVLAALVQSSLVAESGLPDASSIAQVLFLVNMVLAACYFGLLIWSLRAPLPAFLIGAAIYGVTQVLNLLFAPEAVLNVIALVIIVLILMGLVQGIRAAIEVREREVAS